MGILMLTSQKFPLASLENISKLKFIGFCLLPTCTFAQKKSNDIVVRL